MSYSADWELLSRRISGLVDASLAYAALRDQGVSDRFGGVQELARQCRLVFGEVLAFRAKFATHLPRSAHDSANGWIDRYSLLFAKERKGERVDDRLIAMIPALVALDSELTQRLADSQAIILRHTERAFIHLQRLIVADPSIGRQWSDAFEAGEVACERLGSCHLLLHGIWSFKAHGKKGRTDLVLQQEVQSQDVERAASGLVLTEWKLARSLDKVPALYNAACRQAQRYSAGLVAGLELARTRFIVVVTIKTFEGLITEACRDDIQYRFINIAVDPSLPSKIAKNTLI